MLLSEKVMLLTETFFSLPTVTTDDGTTSIFAETTQADNSDKLQKRTWSYMNCDHRRCTRSVNTISSFTVHLRCTACTFTSTYTVDLSVVVRAAHTTSSFTVHSSSTCTALTVILSSTVMHDTYV